MYNETVMLKDFFWGVKEIDVNQKLKKETERKVESMSGLSKHRLKCCRFIRYDSLNKTNYLSE